MPNYSSSKSAWPTKNLFVGGGPSRPMNRISVKMGAPTSFYPLKRSGPTVKSAKRLPRYVGYDRVLTTPKQGKITRILNYLLEDPKGLVKVKPRKKTRSRYEPAQAL